MIEQVRNITDGSVVTPLWHCDFDPTTGDGVAGADPFMLLVRTDVPSLYRKLNDSDPTGWELIGIGGGGGGGQELDLFNDQGTTALAGTPVYVSSASSFQDADATELPSGRTIGVVKADIPNGMIGKVLAGGPITLTTDQWDALCGTTGGLAYNVPYYLSTDPGKLAATPPNVSGQVVQQVLIGVSPIQALVKIADPEVNGAGSSLVTLANDNVGSMQICQPVYSSSADGCDLAEANNSGKGTVIGLVADVTIAPGQRGKVATGGLMVATTAQWDAVCGTSGGLAFGTDYYLSISVAGKLQNAAPTSPTDNGKQVTLVVGAISPTEAVIKIQNPILL